METAGDFLKRKLIVNNDNSNKILNNVNNVINGVSKKKSKYALDRTKFTPNTPETQLAEEMAKALDDLDNYACYLSVVNKLGVMTATQLIKSTLSDIKEKTDTKYPVRNKAKYFMWKFRHHHY